MRPDPRALENCAKGRKKAVVSSQMAKSEWKNDGSQAKPGHLR